LCSAIRLKKDCNSFRKVVELFALNVKRSVAVPEALPARVAAMRGAGCATSDAAPAALKIAKNPDKRSTGIKYQF
jgi:hypothetical protein